MDQISELERALRALAEAFDREDQGESIVQAEAMRAHHQTRLMADMVRAQPDDDPDPVLLASARAWLSSGTEQVQIMQARRYARSIPSRA